MRSNTGLVNELGDDLALAFLVEKKFGETCTPENAVALIAQIRGILSDAQVTVPATAAVSSTSDKKEATRTF